MKVQFVLCALVASAKAGEVRFPVAPPSGSEASAPLMASNDLSQSQTDFVTPGEPPLQVGDSALLGDSLAAPSLRPRERRTRNLIDSVWGVVSDQRFLMGAAGIVLGFALARAAQVSGAELDPNAGEEMWRQCLSTIEGVPAEMLARLVGSYDPNSQSIDVQPVIDMCVNEQLLGPAAGDSQAGLLVNCSLHVQQFFMDVVRACQGGHH